MGIKDKNAEIIYVLIEVQKGMNIVEGLDKILLITENKLKE